MPALMLNYAPTSPAPDPNTVIYFIFMRVGEGSSIEVENGSWAYYWYGHHYQFKGKRYFTGFVYQTPDTGFGEGFAPAHAGRITIAEATFVAAESGATKPWNFVGSQPYIGQFGGYDRVNIISDEEPPVTFQSTSGDYFLAIPTSYLAGGGVEVRTSEIFLRNENGWRFAGSVMIGADNDAAFVRNSSAKGTTAHFHYSGRLEFIENPSCPMPLIKVLKQGTGVDARGQVKTLNPHGIVEYAFDSECSEYRQVQR
jgi:hypothetical protein